MVNNISHKHLPEELLINEIFRRLPIKSLLICKSICKRWNSIISCSNFASFYLNQSPFSKDQSILINTYTNSFLSFDFENHENYKVEVIKETSTQSSNVCMVASCNGLICLNDATTNSLHIWNPITSKQVQIPYPKLITSNNTEILWGFGHMSSTEDYKLIRIIDHENFKKKVQVFSFISNTWKSLDSIESENSDIGKFPPIIGTGVSVNDMVYWGVYYTEYDIGYYDNVCHILGFDLETEKFRVITPLPEWPDHGFFDPPALFKKDGCLCVCWKTYGGDIGIGMYKEDKESGKYSWLKLFHFQHDSIISSQKIQGVAETGKYVVYLDGERIILLDTNQDSPKEVHCLKIPRSRTKNVIGYVKSLLSPINLLGYRN